MMRHGSDDHSRTELHLEGCALIDLVSSFPPAECVRRLRKAVGRECTALGMKGVIGGSITDTRLKLYKTTWYRNDFRVYLFGEFIEEEGTTRIRCHTRMGWYANAFIAGITIFVMQAAIRERSIIPLIALLVLGAIVGIARFAQKYDRDFLVTCLRKTLDARDEPPQKNTDSARLQEVD
jgi:hypothetical protein